MYRVGSPRADGVYNNVEDKALEYGINCFVIFLSTASLVTSILLDRSGLSFLSGDIEEIADHISNY